MIKTLLADDHAMFREPLKHLIQAQEGMEVVAEASRSSEVLPAAKKSKPDVVLLDIEMPGRSCVEVVSDLKGWNRDVKILVVTGVPDKTYAVRLLRAGADGYVSKDAEPATLLEAVRLLFNGHKFIPPELGEELARFFEMGAAEEPHRNLSDREYQVAMLLAKAQTVSEIADELNLSVKTISTYRSRVLPKLGLRNNAEIMRYFLQHGLIRFPDEDDGEDGGAGDEG